ncbi:EndoU domain-containing protein, partial [Clostridium polynesiense]|uniref:EndoU domain-containing protein n=1 Tax=Clostridium polynesiense TaxID=1325933 RepID=UPI001FA731F3
EISEGFFGVNPTKNLANDMGVSDENYYLGFTILLLGAPLLLNGLPSNVPNNRPPMQNTNQKQKDATSMNKGVGNPNASIVSDEMRNKILYGERTKGNTFIGGHSPEITNSNPNYAVEEIMTNVDGTKSVKFTTQFSDGNLAKIKKSTLFPETWSSDSIINGIKQVGDTPSLGLRASDGATFHRGIVNGVEVEVVKVGNNVISGYPTGGGSMVIPTGFK